MIEKDLKYYCLKDSLLALNLMKKLATIVTNFEFSRVCRILIVPNMSGSGGETYERAHVFKPKKGWYYNPIPTLDFASLYPSIIFAHNICFSTLLNGPVTDVAIEKGPEGFDFVKKEFFEGILPNIQV